MWWRKVWHDATRDADLPAVGDWVAIELGSGEKDEHIIRARLPDRLAFRAKPLAKAVRNRSWRPMSTWWWL